MGIYWSHVNIDGLIAEGVIDDDALMGLIDIDRLIGEFTTFPVVGNWLFQYGTGDVQVRIHRIERCRLICYVVAESPRSRDDWKRCPCGGWDGSHDGVYWSKEDAADAVDEWYGE